MAEVEAQPDSTPPKRYPSRPTIDRKVKQKKARYLQSMAQHLDPVRACKFAHTERTTVWRWTQDDPEFVTKLELLTEFATENIEGAVYRRAMKMSTGDARLWLEGHKRDMYGNHQQIDIRILIQRDPAVKALLIGIGQVLQDFVPKEMLASAIARLRTVTSAIDGDSGLPGSEQRQLPNAGTSEAGA